MTTRAELRAALRLRLEDGGGSPLWDEATLNDAIAEGVRRYGARVPRQATTALVVAAGARAAPAPSGIDPGRIVRVLDGAGEVVPRLDAGAVGGWGWGAQAWRWWNDTLLLAAPARAGTWAIEHLAGRTPPADDVAAVDLLPGDEEIVLALARASALRRRATEEVKRGSRSEATRLVEAAEAAADRAFAAKRRAARGGLVETGPAA